MPTPPTAPVAPTPTLSDRFNNLLAGVTASRPAAALRRAMYGADVIPVQGRTYNPYTLQPIATPPAPSKRPVAAARSAQAPRRAQKGRR